jgi:TRAP-type transport system periplasmic protein
MPDHQRQRTQRHVISNEHKEKTVNKYSKAFLASVVAPLVIAFTGPSDAADIKERTIRFAFVQPMDTHWGIGAQKFADLVSEKSNGKMKVRLFPGGSLGGDVQTLSALQGGTINMSMMGTALVAASVKEYAILDLPFLFNDEKEADAVFDGPVGKKLMEKLSDKRVVGLAYWEHGYRNLTNSKRPIAKLEDIDGLKIRVIQVPIYIDMFNALGANAVPMPLPELYSAMEQKVVDGQENPNIAIDASKFNEVQKYLSTTKHVYNAIIVLYSKKAWDELSADERKILVDAANEAKPYQRKAAREMDSKALENLKTKGMTVTVITAQERARMRDRLKPVADKYAREGGGALVKEMYSEIDKVRGAGGSK